MTLNKYMTLHEYVTFYGIQSLFSEHIHPDYLSFILGSFGAALRREDAYLSVSLSVSVLLGNWAL